MKRILCVLALIAMAASCSLADTTVRWDLGKAHSGGGVVDTGYYTEVVGLDGGETAYMYFTDDFDGYVEDIRAQGLWLTNGNVGDSVVVKYNISGFNSIAYDTGMAKVRLYPNADAVASDDCITLGDYTLEDGTVTFTYTLTEALPVAHTLYIEMNISPFDLDNTESYQGNPAAKFSNLSVTVAEREIEPVYLPEPATYAYGVMGLLSVFGLKRRIKK